jgi:hypothetical protein
MRDGDRPQNPGFVMHVHYEDEPRFLARILFDANEPGDKPALLLESDFHASFWGWFTDDQLRVIRATIEAHLLRGLPPEEARRREAAFAATKDFTVEALERIAAEGRTLEFALRESVAPTGKEN